MKRFVDGSVISELLCETEGEDEGVISLRRTGRFEKAFRSLRLSQESDLSNPTVS